VLVDVVLGLDKLQGGVWRGVLVRVHELAAGHARGPVHADLWQADGPSRCARAELKVVVVAVVVVALDRHRVLKQAGAADLGRLGRVAEHAAQVVVVAVDHGGKLAQTLAEGTVVVVHEELDLLVVVRGDVRAGREREAVVGLLWLCVREDLDDHSKKINKINTTYSCLLQGTKTNGRRRPSTFPRRSCRVASKTRRRTRPRSVSMHSVQRSQYKQTK